jgi:hypothetical protein
MPLGRKHPRRNRDAPNSVGIGLQRSASILGSKPGEVKLYWKRDFRGLTSFRLDNQRTAPAIYLQVVKGLSFSMLFGN